MPMADFEKFRALVEVARDDDTLPRKLSPKEVARARDLIRAASARREGLEVETEVLTAGMHPACCANCQRVLFEFDPPMARVRIHCRRCGAANEFRA